MKTAGWMLFIAAVGMMCGLLAVDVGRLTAWGDAIRPNFVASILGHLAAVISAFIGGKLLPGPGGS